MISRALCGDLEGDFFNFLLKTSYRLVEVLSSNISISGSFWDGLCSCVGGDYRISTLCWRGVIDFDNLGFRENGLF
jgi:hypothetical protein